MGRVQDIFELSPGESTPLWAYGALLEHPDFEMAVARLAAGMLALTARDGGLNALCLDAGRFTATLAAVKISAHGDLTLTRLKAAAEASSLLSGGRARSVVQVLLHLGYLEVVSPGAGRSPTLYRFSDRFSSAWTSLLRAGLDAAAVLEPRVSSVSAQLASAAARRAFDAAHGEVLFREGEGDLGFQMPFVQVFLNRFAGSHLAWTVLREAGLTEGGRASLRVAPLARRFRVSPVHVSRLISDACARELLDASGSWHAFTPAALVQARIVYGAQLAHLIATAGETQRRLAAGWRADRAADPLSRMSGAA